MDQTISAEELRKIPFVDVSDRQNRILLLNPFLTEDGEWRAWLPVNGKLVETKMRPSESAYYAKKPGSATDIYFHFLSFFVKHAYWQEVAHPIKGIVDDLHNLGAIIDKIDHLANCTEIPSEMVRRFVSTELEYLVTICRSLIDLLQKTIAALWDTKIKLLDENGEPQRTTKQLPGTFRAMVMYDNNLQTINEIKTRHGLTTPIAQYYHAWGGFFDKLRNYRDHVIHHPSHAPLILTSEQGFAVPTDDLPFSSFDCWRPEDIGDNNFATLDNALAYLIFNTLRMCDEFATTMQSHIAFPNDMIPGFRVYVRGYHNEALLRTKDVYESCLPETEGTP